MISSHLNVNIDHFATLRNARKGVEPSVLDGAKIAVDSGAKGIVCHLREDRRHILDNDIFEIRNAVKAQFDLEMANTEEMINIALELIPDLVTIVPEKREELTTEGGLDIVKSKVSLMNLTNKMHSKGIKVSLFIEPSLDHIRIAKDIGVEMVELHTGVYANHFGSKIGNDELKKLNDAIKFSKDLGMLVAVGHGLNYQNISDLAKNKEIDEFSIGHSIVSNALFLGIAEATQKMLNLINQARC